MELPGELIDPDAEKVVRRLARRGYKAYLVGGCVRDLLLGKTPKDFDVATSATPNEIKQLFRNCRIIGRRFRLAHIFFGGNIIETSTFRANPRKEDGSELLIRRDNVFGSVVEDAHRRDFTVNGLFYDVEEQTVIDHVGGLEDLEKRLIRTIGDPDVRFQEDPVRMLRAVKFAARLSLNIEDATWTALVRHRAELSKCAPPRVLEELYRMLRSASARRSMQLLIDTGIAAVLSPQMAALFTTDVADLSPPDNEQGELVATDSDQSDELQQLSDEERQWAATWREDAPVPARAVLSGDIPSLNDPDVFAGRRALAWKLMDELDKMSSRGDEISNALALAALVNPFVFKDLLEPGVRPMQATEIAMDILRPIVEQLGVPRRDAERARQVLLAQRRLAPSRRRRSRPATLVRRDYFDDALALYEATSLALGHDTSELAGWRKMRGEDAPRDAGATANEGATGATDEMDGSPGSGEPRKRRRRRRGGRRRQHVERDTEQHAEQHTEKRPESQPASGEPNATAGS